MANSPQNWELVKALFEAALECDPAQRSAYVREYAAEQSVRDEVERLLAEHTKAGSFLSSPAYEGIRL